MADPAALASPAAADQQEQAQRRVGAWALGAHIGAGSFAIVWRARHVELQTGAEAAVKEINLSRLNAKLRQSLESEVAILQRIRHPNIVRLHEVLEEGGRLYLVMEYCAGGDLAHFLRAARRVPEGVARHLMRQLAAGLRQMWAHHLVHRDLKPQNLLLSAAAPDATLKIADFGFARNLQPQGLAETLCGSPLYMAPEILHFHKYDAKADLWSCGAILYELVVGRPPFTGANQFQLLRNIERADARVPDAIAAQLSPQCRHLIHCLLRRNPVERLSFEEFFRHPFVATPEEAAAPLPPRAPLGVPADASQQQQAAAQQQQQQQQVRTLLFSTSAPAAAAVAAGVHKSRSSGSIPQQVLGFQQAQQPARLASLGLPGGAAAVPVGGLSNQLKPRRSLDLEGASQVAAALAQQAAAQQGGAPRPQPRRPQPVAGHRLGSIQRVQGFQPAGTGAAGAAGPAPLPGQPPHPAWAPAQRSGPPAAAAASAAASAAAAAAALQPSSRSGWRPGSAAAALAAAAAGGPPGGARPGAAPGPQAASLHSEDEDYVMVDTSLSAHTAGRPGKASQQASPQRSGAPSAAPSLANSRHTSDEDIFALVHPGADTHAAAAAGAQAASWLGMPRWRFLQRVAHALQAAAAARQMGLGASGGGGAAAGPHQALRECLSLHLAALQVLEHAIEAEQLSAAAAATASMVPGGTADDAEPCGSLAGAGGKSDAPTGDAAAAQAVGAAAAAQLQEDAAASMEAAEAAAEALSKAGREPSPTAVTPAGAAAAAEAAEAALPDPWELLYVAALAWGREAAVDELLGNQPRSALLYARAGAALSFLCSEAAALELEPPAELAPPDRARLHKYAAATAVRWAACVAAGGGGEAAMADAVGGG